MTYNKKVSLFVDQLESEQKRKNSQFLIYLMLKKSQMKCSWFGVGFESYHYKYKSGREGDWFLTGFSPRKNAMSTYLMCDLEHKDLNFDGLGKYKKSQGCLYLKKTMILIWMFLEKSFKILLQSSKKYTAKCLRVYYKNLENWWLARAFAFNFFTRYSLIIIIN